MVQWRSGKTDPKALQVASSMIVASSRRTASRHVQRHGAIMPLDGTHNLQVKVFMPRVSVTSNSYWLEPST
ncbi:hypothetical protein SLA2020_144360 [Shorea laevis]